jgi:hypothetical protein
MAIAVVGTAQGGAGRPGQWGTGTTGPPAGEWGVGVRLAVQSLRRPASRSVMSIRVRAMYHYGWARTLGGAKKSQIACTVQILEAGRRGVATVSRTKRSGLQPGGGDAAPVASPPGPGPTGTGPTR